MTRKPRIALAALIAVVLALTLSSCAKTMDADKIEKSSKGYLNDKLDEQFDKVSCPDGKDAKDGVKFDCTFEGNDGTTGKIAISVSSSDGDYTLELAELKFTPDYVEKTFTKEYGDTEPALKSIECPADKIPSKAGDSVTCDLEATTGETGTVDISLTDSFSFDYSEIKPTS